MGIEIKITCDGCGLVAYQDIEEQGPEVYLPDDWITVEDTNNHWLYFHSDDCYTSWIKRENRLDDLKNYMNATPMA